MTIDYLSPHVHKVYNTVSGNPPQFHRDQWVCSFFCCSCMGRSVFPLPSLIE